MYLHDIKEKNKLLRQWVASGMNLQACESRIKVSKEQGLRGEKVWAQVPVRDMGIPPLNFSEFLGASIIIMTMCWLFRFKQGEQCVRA